MTSLSARMQGERDGLDAVTTGKASPRTFSCERFPYHVTVPKVRT